MPTTISGSKVAEEPERTSRSEKKHSLVPSYIICSYRQYLRGRKYGEMPLLLLHLHLHGRPVFGLGSPATVEYDIVLGGLCGVLGGASFSREAEEGGVAAMGQGKRISPSQARIGYSTTVEARGPNIRVFLAWCRF
jgi:hypothetical protein